MARRKTSSLEKKLSYGERVELANAIQRQEPGATTLEALYEQFDLKAKGISFAAFGRWSRRAGAMTRYEVLDATGGGLMTAVGRARDEARESPAMALDRLCDTITAICT